MRAPGRKYASRACVRCRKKKRRCDGKNCSSCAKENIPCVVDLETDQRRQINRSTRNTRDRLPDRLLSALRTAPTDDVHALVEVARKGATSLELEALVDQLSSRGEDQKMLTAKNARSPSDPCELPYDWLQTPTNSEIPLDLEHQPPLLVTDSTTFPSRNGVQMADSDQRQFGSPCGSMSSSFKSKTGTLARVMLSFREAACAQIADGAYGNDILSMPGLELDLFFRDRIVSDPYTVSAWACEFAKSWTSLSPVSQLAVVYFAGAFMRWYILPCKRTYALMSAMLQPLDGNAMVHDHSQIEHCRSHGVDWIDNLTLNTQRLSWPYPCASCLEEPVAGPGPRAQRLSKLFMDFCDDPANWRRANDRLNIS